MAIELIKISEFPQVSEPGDWIVVSDAAGTGYKISKEDFKEWLGTVTVITDKPIALADPAPALDGVYLPTEPGTYTNAGGLVYDPGGVDAGKYVQFIKNDTAWTKLALDLPQADLSGLATKEETQTAVEFAADTSTAGKNKSNKETFVGKRWMPDGTHAISSVHVSTPLYETEGGKTWAISGHRDNSSATDRVIFFDDTMTVLDESTIIKGNGTSQTIFTTPANARYMGINVSDSLGGGTVTDNQWSNAFQLEEGGTVTVYEPYTLGVRADKIIGDLPYAKDSDLIPLQNTIDSWKTLSPNLVDKTKVLEGYFQSNGNPAAGATSRRVFIAVEPNTEYSITGVLVNLDAQIGNEYSSSSVATSATFLNPIPGTGITNRTFTTGPNTYGIGVNIALNKSNAEDYVDTAMVNIGNPLPYQPFGELINPDMIKSNGGDVNIETLSPVYVEFNPTGYSGREQWTVYVRRGTANSYVGHIIGRDYNMTDPVYLDYFRIIKADEYELINGSMNLIASDSLTVGESECVWKRYGVADHTGGVHGDEIMIDVTFFIDGVKVDNLSSSIPLTPCNSFAYLENSSMHETAPVMGEFISGHPIDCYHLKFTELKDSGYSSYNKLTWARTVPVLYWYHGICCIGKMQGTSIITEQFETIAMDGSGSDVININGPRKVRFYNGENNYSAMVTSKVLDNEPVDSVARLFVKDNGSNSKYYRRAYGNANPILDEVWESEMVVEYLGKG